MKAREAHTPHTPQEILKRLPRRLKGLSISDIIRNELALRKRNAIHEKESRWARQKWIWQRFFELMKGKIFQDRLLHNKRETEAFETLMNIRMRLRILAENTTLRKWIPIPETIFALKMGRAYTIARARRLQRKTRSASEDAASIKEMLDIARFYERNITILKKLRQYGLQEIPVGGMHDHVKIRNSKGEKTITIEEWYERKHIPNNVKRPHVQGGWFSSILEHQLQSDLTILLGPNGAERLWEIERDVRQKLVHGIH